MLRVFANDIDGGVGPDWQHPFEASAPTSARLLWALRRMALIQPLGLARCHAVHIALQQEFGDAGQGIEHLLRCILFGLSRTATRRLAFAVPGCRLVTPDEAALLPFLAGDAAAPDLGRVAGAPAAQLLLPLFATLADLVAAAPQPSRLDTS